MEILDEPTNPKINPEQTKVFKFILYTIAGFLFALSATVFFYLFIGMAIEVGSKF